MQLTITSPQNPRIKGLLKLRDAKCRALEQAFIVDGPREILRAVAERWELPEAYVCTELIRDEMADQALIRLQGEGCDVVFVSSRVWEKIAFGNRRDGILAIGRSHPFLLAKIVLPREPLVVVLEQTEKPGNLGAVLRTADAMGATAVFLADPHVEPLNPNVIRASAGTVFHVPLAVASVADIQGWLADHSFRILVARVDAPESIYTVDPSGPVALVLGNEASGVTHKWHACGGMDVSLPMRGKADSLNLSVTAAVMLYELSRRRQATK